MIQPSQIRIVVAVTFLIGLSNWNGALAQENGKDKNSNADIVDERDLTVVWSDEFDYEGAPNPDRWTHDIGFLRNEESQYYRDSRENSWVKDGVLTIQARKQSVPNAKHQPGSKNWKKARASSEHTSACLTTAETGTWTYGRFEVRANMPKGRGVWPAIWMLGTSFRDADVGWPRCGEIDIMEFVGHQPSEVHAHVHCEKYNHMKQNDQGASLTVEDVSDGFHVYAVDWTEDKMDFFVDDKKYFTYKREDDPQSWPFDRPHYLILNLAIGGMWGGKEGIDDSIFPQQLQVDFVRVHQYVDRKDDVNSTGDDQAE